MPNKGNYKSQNNNSVTHTHHIQPERASDSIEIFMSCVTLEIINIVVIIIIIVCNGVR
jgi:hypothetical protein